MRNTLAKVNKHSKKGTTLVELVVAMTLTLIFAAVCVALINPIERTYQDVEKTSRAQLLADTIIDSIRKECDDVQYDDPNAVWLVPAGNDRDDDQYLFAQPSDIADNNGNVLVIKKDNKYCEAIYSCFPISAQSISALATNPADGSTDDKAAKTLTGDNLNRGLVHFGYYQGRYSKAGLYPFKAYDYTNPVTASTYGDFTVALKFEKIGCKTINGVDYPAFIECTVNVYKGDYSSSDSEFIYSRTAAVCFSANGSAQGSAGSIITPPDKHDIRVIVNWDDESNAHNTRPTGGVSYMIYDNNDKVLGTYELKDYVSDQKTFVFANVDTSNGINIKQIPDPVNANYMVAYVGTNREGYIISNELADDTPRVKLIPGIDFRNAIGTDVTNVIFAAATPEYLELVEPAASTFKKYVSIDREGNPTDDYSLFIVNKDGKKYAYILSADGKFIANENCESMFKDCKIIEAISGLDCLDTRYTTTMDKMFDNIGVYQDKKIALDLTGFKFDNCTNINKMFCVEKTTNPTCPIETIVFPDDHINLSNVTKIDAVFSGCKNLKNLKNFNDIDFSGLTAFTNVFNGCSSIEELNISKWNCSNLVVLQATDQNGNLVNNRWLFTGLSSVKTLNLNGLQLPQCTDTNILNLLKDLNSLEVLYLNDWNIGGVTNLDGYFKDKTKLQEIYLNGCATENLVSADSLFSGCVNLKTVEMDSFIKENCTDIGSMFYNCKNLGVIDGLDSWQTSGVTDMAKLFCNYHTSTTDSITLDISNFDFSSATNMSNMFEGSGVGVIRFPGTSSTVVFTNVSNISEMFKTCKGLTKIEGFNVSFPNVLDASGLFRGCEKLTTADFNMQFAIVENIDYMFSGCTSIDDVKLTMHFPSVTSANGLFNNCSSLTQATLDFEFGQVNSVDGMFANCSSLSELKLRLIVPNAKSAKNLFNGCSSLNSLELNADFSEVTDISYMFGGCSSLETASVDLDFAKVENASYLFNNCTSLKKLDCVINLPKAENIEGFFNGCTSLEKIENLNLSMGYVKNANKLFNGCTKLSNVTLTLDLPAAESVNNLFNGCNKLSNAELKLNLPTATDISNMFKGCSSLKELTAEIDVPLVTDMNKFFDGVPFTSINLSNSDFSGLTSSTYMFYKCAKLTHITMDGVNMSGCTSTDFTFGDCNAIKYISMQGANLSGTQSIQFIAKDTVVEVNLTGSDLSSVTSLEGWSHDAKNMNKVIFSGADLSSCGTTKNMFSGKTKLTTVDFSNVKLDICTDMSYMFNGCSGLTTVNFIGLNTSDAVAGITCESMFLNCKALNELDFSGWDTSNVTNMKSMFQECFSLPGIDFTKWQGTWSTARVTNMSYMFYNCCYGTTTYDPQYIMNLSNFNFASATDLSYMFGCKDEYKDNVKDIIFPVGSTGDSDPSAYEGNPKALNVQKTIYMFTRRTNLVSITNLGWFELGENLTEAKSMFSRSGCYELDIRRIRFVNLKSGDNGSAWIFGTCRRLTTIYVAPGTDYSSNWTGKENFNECFNLVGGGGTAFTAANNGRAFAKIDDPDNNVKGYFTSKGLDEV